MHCDTTHEQTTKIMSCAQAGCGNYGNSKKQGYCNAHGDALGIAAANVCEYTLCHGGQVGFGSGPSLMVQGVELPSGFTKILTRPPVPGDTVITMVNVAAWMSNSVGRVATVDESRGQALIHFACFDSHMMSYAHKHFVVIE
jgi:hypothetical protein